MGVLTSCPAASEKRELASLRCVDDPPPFVFLASLAWAKDAFVVVYDDVILTVDFCFKLPSASEDEGRKDATWLLLHEAKESSIFPVVARV